ncbi:hypothetical protein [Streptomyces buecherae]|uniref:hypothetical protein n=1 Tax=Streptomyces buecherae TaxID=2763006 RepID=UPI0027E31022|nr:hypothetical protein [Streptomyces buecherae]
MSERLAGERASTVPTPGQVVGRAVTLIPHPHRTSGVAEGARPSGYRRVLAAVWQGAGPVTARQVGEMLRVDFSVWAGLESLRGKLVRLADRGWLRELPEAGSPFARAQERCRPDGAC